MFASQKALRSKLGLMPSEIKPEAGIEVKVLLIVLKI